MKFRMPKLQELLRYTKLLSFETSQTLRTLRLAKPTPYFRKAFALARALAAWSIWPVFS